MSKSKKAPAPATGGDAPAVKAAAAPAQENSVAQASVTPKAPAVQQGTATSVEAENIADAVGLLTGEVEAGCGEWARKASEKDPPSLQQKALEAALGMAGGLIAGKLGSIVGAGLGQAFSAAVGEKAKGAVEGAVKAGVTAGVTAAFAEEDKTDAIHGFAEGVRRTMGLAVFAQQKTVRTEVARLPGDQQASVSDGKIAELTAQFMSGGVAAEAFRACTDSYLTSLAAKRFGTEAVEGVEGEQVKTDAMRDKTGWGDVGSGVVRVELNNMLGPDGGVNALGSSLTGANAKIQQFLGGRKLSDIQVPKMIVGNKMQGDSYFRIFINERGDASLLSASGSTSFFGGGDLDKSTQTKQSFDYGEGGADKSKDGYSGGQGWLAAHGEWYFNQKAANQDIATHWGVVALTGLMSKTTYGVSGPSDK
jgi:hypothetical protein